LIVTERLPATQNCEIQAPPPVGDVGNRDQEPAARSQDAENLSRDQLRAEEVLEDVEADCKVK